MPDYALRPIRTGDTPAVPDRILTADWSLIAAAADGSVAGWGALYSWTEQDGVHLHVAHGHVRPTDRRRGLGGALLDAAEQAAARITRDRGLTGTVLLGGNADEDDAGRTALLLSRGYRPVFTMVRMTHDGTPPEVRPLPGGVSVRPAAVADAAGLHRLALRAWAGRPYFAERTEEQLRAWLIRSDRSRFQVATAGQRIIGLVAVTDDHIEDVQIDPDFQRRGLATALLTRTLAGLGGPCYLWTEGHDPAGARTLYDRLGFRVTTVAHRYRKPLR